MTRDSVCPPDHAHGATSNCYLNHQCGCSPCLVARTEYQYWRRGMLAAGRGDVFDTIIDGRGVRRRLQALMALGYSARRIGARLDVTDDQVLHWLNVERVRRSSHARIDAVYEQLSGRVPPMDTPGNRASAIRARNLARRRGYVPPLAWDDIDTDSEPQNPEPTDAIDVVVVELATQGKAPRPLTIPERRTTVAYLSGVRKLADTVISRWLGVDEKTIANDRAALGLPAAVGADRQPLTEDAAAA